jgi:hypothetical protein
MFKQLLVRQVAVKGGGVGNAERIEANLLASIGSCNGLRDIVRVARFQFSVFDHGGGLPSLLLLLVVLEGVGRAFLQKFGTKRR